MTRGRVPLDAALATPDSKRRYVRRLFSAIADRYDLITVLLSFGMDARWKRRVVALASPQPGQRVLDLACGTGDLTFGAAEACAQAVGLDITFRMLELARTRSAGRGTHLFWIQGDMLSLPFADASFDIVTTGYGLRNVPDLRGSIAEIRRVLRPGGTLVSLDFNRPANRLLRAIYLGYLWFVGGLLGWILHGDPDTYRYIPASIEHYPGAPGVVRLMEDEGFTEARWLPVLGGLMAIHIARVSARPSSSARA
jgi:demethylmenaquinone methyltransferase/2-methoxy-6-polyprenyl-1,4-benzoquinol methylase